MKPRILILPISALIIAALVAWRLQREPKSPTQVNGQAGASRLAPRFELYDQSSQLVKLERYLGRTRLLVAFFDGESAFHEDRLFAVLRDNYAALKSAGVDVIAVGSATPSAIREAERESGKTCPFPILTDIDPYAPVPVPVHRRWGLANDETNQTESGLFFIDRDGTVAYEDGYPVPLEDPEQFILGFL